MEVIFIIAVLIYIIGVLGTIVHDMSRHPRDVKDMFLNFWIVKYPWKWIVSDRIKSRMKW